MNLAWKGKSRTFKKRPLHNRIISMQRHIPKNGGKRRHAPHAFYDMVTQTHALQVNKTP